MLKVLVTTESGLAHLASVLPVIYYLLRNLMMTIV